MGWFYSHSAHQRKHIVDEIISMYPSDKGWAILENRSTSYGRRLWLTIQPPVGEAFVALYLLGTCKGYWGYKDVDESMGPVAVDCPLSVIDAAGLPMNEHAKKWRERVRVYHTKVIAVVVCPKETHKGMEWRDSNEGPFDNRTDAEDYVRAEFHAPTRIIETPDGWVIKFLNH